ECIVAALVSHGHADHLPAAVRLREERGVPIFGHPDLAAVDRPVVDGEEIRVGAACLTVYHTPGHAPDHLCAWNAADRVLFTGDLIAGEGTVVLSDEHRALSRYLGSLNRMLALRPAMLLPGHGPPVPNAESHILAYLVHRAQREEQVLAALRFGPATVDALVARLYADTPAALLPMAARNVRAHLENLEERGLVRQEGEEWEIIDPIDGRG
ncbi:MAG TPA: MBL fold metallo-hydrolase, partial [Chloroflexota bacterium]|nr:MBL fold metallo-hydrolase [Chloroflexota bacterium]